MAKAKETIERLHYTDKVPTYFKEDGQPKVKWSYYDGKKLVKEEVVND